ncbi:MAG: hypothetical protein J5871_00030 [Bacteroidales bacterium]|nr:hypothetical protein [Bacteroidales bacterium]
MADWYGLQVFYNRIPAVQEMLQRAREPQEEFELYSQHMIPSLLFVRCGASRIERIRRDYGQYLKVYTSPEGKPAPIREKEMQMFILVTSAADNDLLFLGDDLPEYHIGERVRVKEGPFKGAEGCVRRIKKNRRVVVSIDGIAAVALSFIPLPLLEHIETD